MGEEPGAIVAGFDVHRRQITVDALDTATGEVSRGQLESTPTAVEAWVAGGAQRRRLLLLRPTVSQPIGDACFCTEAVGRRDDSGSRSLLLLARCRTLHHADDPSSASA
jgi:hypothetical protein